MPNQVRKSPAFGHASESRSAQSPIKYRADRYAEDGPRRRKMPAYDGAQARQGRTRIARDYQLMQLD